MITKFNNILVVRTDRMGDVVLTTPVFKALRKSNPRARITVLVTPATKDLVEGNPYVDEVLVDERKGCHQDFFGFLRLARQLRQRQFDAAVIFHTKRRYNLACFIAGIPMRVGFKNKKFGGLLTHPLKDERHLGQKHEAQYCLDVLMALGVEGAGLDLFLPVQRDAEQWVGQWLSEHNIKPYEIIAIHPGASDATKCWPSANFSKLIDSLNQRYLLKVVLIGGLETISLSSDILRQCQKVQVLDMTGQTSVAQTISLLRRCRLLISNDSGPVHAAAAVGIYVISLFLRNQPGINPERWKPLGPKGFVLANKSGEAIQLDSKGQIADGKIDSISVDEVLEQVEKIFQKDAQSNFHW